MVRENLHPTAARPALAPNLEVETRAAASAPGDQANLIHLGKELASASYAMLDQPPDERSLTWMEFAFLRDRKCLWTHRFDINFGGGALTKPQPAAPPQAMTAAISIGAQAARRSAVNATSRNNGLIGNTLSESS